MAKTITHFEKYKLVIQSENYRFRLEQFVLEKSRPQNTAERKIYIIKHEEDFIYVGEAKNSIKQRFQRGFAAFRYYIKNNKSRDGYRGYKLLQQKFTSDIIVWVTVFAPEYNEDREFIEAVEGELVFLIRSLTGKWPLYQNEIHFHNKKGASVVANKIWKRMLKK